MRIFSGILLMLLSLTGIAQIDFESDINKEKLYSDLIPKIKVLNQDFDFQLRFWQNEGMIFPCTRKLFTMTLKNGTWSCKSFDIQLKNQTDYRIKKKRNKVENCDSIWNFFIKNHILQLPDMNLLQKDFYTLIKLPITEPVISTEDVETGRQMGNTLKVVTIIASGYRRTTLVVADGGSYSLEFFKDQKYKRIVYYEPLRYAKEYKKISELQYFSNILNYIEEIWK